MHYCRKPDLSFRSFLTGMCAFSFLVIMCGCEAKPAEPERTSLSDSIFEQTTENIDQTVQETSSKTTSETSSETAADTTKELQMKLFINDSEVSVTWEDNESVKALKDLAGSEGIEINMSMYGGFEQVGPIGQSLPINDEQITTQAGDIVLYSGDQIVVFYGSNSWSYTSLGKIDDKTAEELEVMLSNGDVVLKIKMA